MDLGIKGKLAIVCASSRGLGFGCANELAANGVDLVMNGINIINPSMPASDIIWSQAI